MSSGSPAENLMDPDLFRRDGFDEVFRQLRRDCPIAPVHVNDRTYWHVTTHGDIAKVYKNPAVFSSRSGAIAGSSYRASLDTAADRMLVSTDPPRHRYLRTTLQSMVTRSYTTRVGERVRTVLGPRLDELLASGHADFMSDIAVELPLAALHVLFGLNRDQGLRLIGITRRIIGYLDDDILDRHPAAAIADNDQRLAVLQVEAFEFFDEMLDAGPNHDGIVWQQLRQAEVNGEPLSHEEVLYNALNLAVGGNETTAYTAGHAVLGLQRGSSYDLLLSGLCAPETVLTEILRWSSTNAYVQRVVTKTTEISGTRIPAGDSVMVWNYSGNHDEAVFNNADVLDLQRPANLRHLAFGMGIHRCVAASLGSAELQALLTLLVDRKIRIVPTGKPDLMRSNFIRGVVKLNVSVSTEAG